MEYLMRSLENCPKYSRQELIDLGRQYQEHGDLQAREQMILGILPLAVNRAKGYFLQGREQGVLMQELVSEAMLGVIRAVDKFDPDRGVALTTYATYWIDQFLKRALCNCGIIHVPEYLIKSTRALSEELQSCMDRVCSVYPLHAKNTHATDGDEQLSLAETLGDQPSQNRVVQKFEEFEKQCYQQNRVQQAVAQITDDRLRGILLGRLRGCTLAQMGLRYGVTKERIRQLEKIGREQLRKILLSQVPLEEIGAA